jgi:hypothetical protein
MREPVGLSDGLERSHVRSGLLNAFGRRGAVVERRFERAYDVLDPLAHRPWHITTVGLASGRSSTFGTGRPSAPRGVFARSTGPILHFAPQY